ncbi:hypothetical protein [Caulobacter vibrioides]|uniref:hypothetical protein n=1 Tax=Caulobacter vibrioides TaxID=155892 RepID=UPI000BB4B602|nr:hypothetical protein [Caulobacter vibrioides]ATC24540.1 hypothetical protein CA608_08440 [Caulobacter vibrioides]PLR15124.1 hypothetical protein CVUC_04035 [Caulobacter vibrioides]
MTKTSTLAKLFVAGALLATITAPAAFAKPQYMHYDGIKGEAAKTRPRVAAGDVNGDGRADARMIRDAELKTRKDTGAQTTKGRKDAVQAPRTTGLLLPAVQKAH